MMDIYVHVCTYIWTITYTHPLCVYLLDSFCQREIQAQSGRRWAVAFTTSSKCWVMVVTYVELRVSLLSSMPCPLLPCTDHWYASADAVLCKPMYVHICTCIYMNMKSEGVYTCNYVYTCMHMHGYNICMYMYNYCHNVHVNVHNA